MRTTQDYLTNLKSLKADFSNSLFPALLSPFFSGWHSLPDALGELTVDYSAISH